MKERRKNIRRIERRKKERDISWERFKNSYANLKQQMQPLHYHNWDFCR
jgi:hypothetical protein